MPKELDYKLTWDGEYKGVRFEIVHWCLGWNYYLYLPIEQLPDEVKTIFDLPLKESNFGEKSRGYFDYSGVPIISDLDWHGGITLYEKERDVKGNVIGYRLGCDFMHHWDEGKHFEMFSVKQEAEGSIDKLWELVPDLKLRCSYNGQYYPKDEIYYTELGVRVAKVNKVAWERPLFSKEN